MTYSLIQPRLVQQGSGLFYGLKKVISRGPILFSQNKIAPPLKNAGIIVAGLGLAALGFIGKYALKAAPAMSQRMAEAVKALPKMDAESFGASKYYKGGFDTKMSKREASLILGISPAANKLKIKEAHKRIMSLNHPDRGGSPYLAAKINEAKDHLDSGK